MKKFILIAEKILLDDFTIQVTVFPEDILIKKYILSTSNFNHQDATDENINNFILELTPILFNDFQNMENIPSFIKEQFEL